MPVKNIYADSPKIANNELSLENIVHCFNDQKQIDVMRAQVDSFLQWSPDIDHDTVKIRLLH